MWFSIYVNSQDWLGQSGFHLQKRQSEVHFFPGLDRKSLPSTEFMFCCTNCDIFAAQCNLINIWPGPISDAYSSTSSYRCRSFLQEEVTLDIPSSYTEKYFAFRALPILPAWLGNQPYLCINQLPAAEVTAINSCRFETDGKFDYCIRSVRPLSWWLFYFHFSLFFKVIPWPSFIKVKYLNCLRTNFELFYDLSKSPLRLEA